MRLILSIIAIFTITLNSFGQDTIYGSKSDSLVPFQILQSEQFYFADCAHGHICCAVGCLCCGELKREQLYDTIYHPKRDGIQRISVIERYYYASSHEPFSLHYRFKNEKGELSKKWYRAETQLDHFFSGLNEDLKKFPKHPEEYYLKHDRALVVDTSGEYFLIDLNGTIQSMPYIHSEFVDDGLYLSSIIVNNKRIYGFTNERQEKVGPLAYYDIKPFDSNGLAIALNTKHKFGLLDKYGNVQLPFIYELLEPLGEGNYIARLNGEQLIINKSGVILNEKKFLSVMPYSERKAFVRIDEKNGAFINTNGKELFKIKCQWAYDFHDGLAAVYNGSKWGFIDTTGKLAIEYQYFQVRNFHEGVAPVCTGQNSNTDEWFLINQAGKVISDRKYAEIENFKNGYARTFVNGEGWGFISNKGRELFEPMYSFEGYGSANDWFVNGMMIRRKAGVPNSWEIIDPKEKQLIDLSKYESASFQMDAAKPNTFLPYILVYKKDRKTNIIDVNGKELLKSDYEFVHTYSNDVALGMKNQRYYLLSLTTGEIIKAFDEGRNVNFNEGILQSESKDYPRNYKYYNLKGEELEVFGFGE